MTIHCSNPDHARPTPAAARLTWPCGRFRPTFACKGEIADAQRDALDEGYTLLIEPLPLRERPKGPLDYAPAVQKIGRLYRQAYAEPVKAILLEAPDMPGYDELPDTLEEREKLPARFHVPCWDGNGKPNLWVCAVCWDEGTVNQWPCKVASERGGEVSAR